MYNRSIGNTCACHNDSYVMHIVLLFYLCSDQLFIVLTNKSSNYIPIMLHKLLL